MTKDNEQLWQAVLGEVELTLSKAGFTTWFKNTFIIENEEGRVIIGVPNTFSQAWLKQKYHNEIFKTLQNLTGQRVKEINYKVENKKDFKPIDKPLPREEKSVVRPETISVPAPKFTGALSEGFSNLNENYIFTSFIVGKHNELAHAAVLTATFWIIFLKKF